MKIGVLNELLNSISCALVNDKCPRKIKADALGNPLKGEVSLVKWDEVRDGFVEFKISLGEKCFVDEVKIEIGNRTNLSAVVLKDSDGILSKHVAETGKTITDKCMTLKAGSLTDALTVCLEAEFSDVELSSVKLYGAVLDEKDVFPTPDKLSFQGEVVEAKVFDSYCADSDDGLCAGKILAEKYEEITGVCMSLSDKASVRFVTDENVPEEGFSLSVNKTGAEIKARDLRGFVMGAETFIKLSEPCGVHGAAVEDKPAYPFRGVHLFLPSKRMMPFAKRLVKYLVSPMGYNKIIFEIAGGMRFDSHPEINEAVIHANKMNEEGKWPEFPHSGVAERGCVEKEDVRELVAYVRSFGIDVIPEVQSLGHVQFMTIAHPDIAEIDENAEDKVDTVNEDARPKTFYKHCYCPSNPKSYEILFDLLDEIIEVFKPGEYVHMGHDEVYQIGVCPVCKNKDAAQLYYDDVMKIYNYLSAKGLKMMIWSDMIQPVSGYATRPAIDMLPKDIVMLDFIWYFHFDKDIEENLLEKGYTVAVGNLYSSHYPRFETRIRKKGMIGGQISAWVGTTESAMQKEGKLYDYIMTSQMLWSDDYRKEYTLCYDRMIKALMPKMRENLKGIKYPSLAKGAERIVIAENAISFPPSLGVSQNTKISVDGEYKSLVFSHTELKKLTRLPWQDYDVTGKYVLSYSDGTTEEISITNNGIIGYWNRRQNEPIVHPMYRHTGYTCTYYTDSDEYKTKEGEDVCIYKYEHILPEEKTVVSVELEQSEEFNTDIFLVKLEGIK